MIPILYESTETAFTSNGLGRLRDCISCKVVESRNSVYECDFEYPITGSHYEDIKLGRIIAVDCDSNEIQPFDIVSASKPINGIVSFHAVHISYRLSKLVAYGSNINSLADAFTMLESTLPEMPFTFETDITSSAYMAAANGVPQSVKSLLGGVEGSILDTYGGEYEWDQFVVRLHEARGEYRNVTIRYGVNLQDYTDDTDYSESFTSCIPYWTGTDDNNNDVIVVGDQVDSSLTSYNSRNDCVPLDLTDKFEDQPTTSDLESAALSYMTGNDVNLPSQTITVDFLLLQNTTEYAAYADLLDCGLCDSVRVIFPEYGMDGRFKIVKTTYDVLKERYESMELGTLSTTLSEALGISDSSSKLTSSTGMAITSVNYYSVSMDSTASQGSATSTVTITEDTDADDYLIIPYATNWHTIANITRSGLTVTVKTLNIGSSTHSALVRFMAVGYKSY